MATMRGAALALAAMLMLAVTARAADDELRTKALKLNEITGDDAAKAKANELFKDAKATKKLLDVAVKMAKEKDQPFNVNATSILAAVAGDLGQYDASEQFYRVNLEQALKLQSAPKIGNAFVGLSQVLLESKKYEESLKVCQKFMELEVDEKLDADLGGYKVAAVRRMIICLVRLKKVDKANEILERLLKAAPDNWLNLALKGQVLRETEDYEGAVKVYESVMEQVTKDDGLMEDVKKEYLANYRYILSGVYMDLNQTDKATDLLQTLLKDEPDNPTYNNDLGYIWADHDKNLDQAEKLIRKALEEDRKLRKKENPDLKPEDDKDNASYIDSLGWVLFKKKQYKEAKEQLEKAVKDEDGKHIDVYDHLAEIHMALGEKKEAIAAWEQGVKVAGPSKRDQDKKTEIEKKIKEKQ